jgi:regulator of ribonuclease activity A
VRDSAEIRGIPFGIRALNTSPARSGKIGSGEQGGTVSFAGAAFSRGQFLYADEDGLIISRQRLAP